MKVTRTSEAVPLADAPEPRSDAAPVKAKPQTTAEPREDEVRAWGFELSPADLADDHDFGPLAGGALERVDQDDDETESTPLGDGLPTVVRDDARESGFAMEPLGHVAGPRAPRPSGITREDFSDMPADGGVVRGVGLQRGGGNVREALGVDRPDRARRMLEARRAGGDMRAALGVDDDG